MNLVTSQKYNHYADFLYDVKTSKRDCKNRKGLICLLLMCYV